MKSWNVRSVVKRSLSCTLRRSLALLCAVIGGNTFADYVVNSTGDNALYGNRLGLCETAPFNGVCTLRAATQASNSIGGTNISFNIPTSDPGYSGTANATGGDGADIGAYEFGAK